MYDMTGKNLIKINLLMTSFSYQILSTVKSELYHMFSILEREDTDRLTMSVSADHVVTLERDGSQKSHNSSSNPEDFFPEGEFPKDDSDSVADDEDYVVVSFT